MNRNELNRRRGELMRDFQRSVADGDDEKKEKLREEIRDLNAQINGSAEAAPPPIVQKPISLKPKPAPEALAKAKPTSQKSMSKEQNQTIGGRLKAARVAVGFGVGELARGLEFPRSRIYDVESGKGLTTTRQPVENFLHVNPAWLDTGDGEMFASEPPKPPTAPVASAKPAKAPKARTGAKPAAAAGPQPPLRDKVRTLSTIERNFVTKCEAIASGSVAGVPVALLELRAKAQKQRDECCALLEIAEARFRAMEEAIAAVQSAA